MVNWIEHYCTVINIMLMVVYTLATIIILASNYSSNRLLKKQIKKDIGVGLYDKRIAILNNVNKLDFSNTFAEIEILFDKPTYFGIKKLSNLVEEKAKIYIEFQEYNYLAHDQEGYDPALPGHDSPPEVVYGCCGANIETGNIKEYRYLDIMNRLKKSEEQISKQKNMITRKMYDYIQETISDS